MMTRVRGRSCIGKSLLLGNVVDSPLESEPLVLNGLVSIDLALDVEESKRTKTVVDGDNDHVLGAGKVSAIVQSELVTITEDVTSSVHPKHHRQGLAEPVLARGVHVELKTRTTNNERKGKIYQQQKSKKINGEKEKAIRSGSPHQR